MNVFIRGDNENSISFLSSLQSPCSSLFDTSSRNKAKVQSLPARCLNDLLRIKNRLKLWKSSSYLETRNLHSKDVALRLELRTICSSSLPKRYKFKAGHALNREERLTNHKYLRIYEQIWLSIALLGVFRQWLKNICVTSQSDTINIQIS